MAVSLTLTLTLSIQADTTYYLTGNPADQANKAVDAAPSTPTFNTTTPTGAAPITQTATPLANSDFVGNPLAAFWSGPYSGPATGVLDLRWYWSTANPATVALGSDVEVTVFADPDYAADPEQPNRIIGRATVPLTGISATPTLVQSLIPINGNVQGTLLIQVVSAFVDTGNGILIHYASTATPSSFTIHAAPPRIPFDAATQASGYAPRYKAYAPSNEQLAAGLGIDAGEPSIGANWFTDKVMFQAMLQTLRVSFDDSCATTPGVTFENKSSAITSQISFDPILYTDRYTGRTMVSQLLFPTTDSAAAYTDDDGNQWFPSQGAGIASGIDHQTLGGGPFHLPKPAGANWPTAVYYCAQDIALANCAISLDGGRTFGPAVPIYQSQQCGGLHGHIKVAPDGTAYVPNKGCGSKQGVVVSEDNGITWDIRTVPNSLAASSDPSVAIARDGRVYLAFMDNDNYPIVAVSDDRGHNWFNIKDVGKLANINNAVFAAMVAGDKNRAAVAYIGTTTPGSLQSREFSGVWHMYLSTTYDGGNTWHTVNATPNDPVQRGPIWLKGGGEMSRNLLDFMDATIDREGRVLVGFADGCIGDCVGAPDSARGNTYEDITSIIRQTGGRRMFPEFDPADLSAPGAPTLTVSRNGSLARLTWSQANGGGYPTTTYSVYRKEGAAGAEKLMASGVTASSWNDPTIDDAKTYIYRVAATNGGGTSCGSNAVTSAPRGSSCNSAGVRILNDAAGDQTGAPLNPAFDIQSVSIAEPYNADGSQKITFILKVESLSILPPLSQWRVIWNFPTTAGGQYYADMRTNESGAVSFEYGEILVTDAVVTSVGEPSKLGDADPSSSYTTDGTIRIVLPASAIGNLVPGDLIGGLIARTYLGAGSAVTTYRVALDSAEESQTYRVVGSAFCTPPAVSCIEDDDASIGYSIGWQNLAHDNASAGHFAMAGIQPPEQVGPDYMEMAINVPAGQYGAITYHYATSRKGGTAEVFIDDVSQGTIDYLGFAGDTAANPVFGASKRYAGLQPGQHVFSIRGNGNGAIYIDKVCLESSSSNGHPTEGPGAATTGSGTLLPGGELVTAVTLNSNAKALSVVMEATGGNGKIVVLNPLGAQIATATTNSKGLASIRKTITQPGVYIVKTINLSLGPIKVWTAATPTITR
ncbi:MAG TPA: hypothetical protein VKB93_13765 [Thermoanaerobaculia bacterium]|nr:hypothetical protein [Thermoanaerobaculia bacterium]